MAAARSEFLHLARAQGCFSKNRAGALIDQGLSGLVSFTTAPVRFGLFAGVLLISALSIAYAIVSFIVGFVVGLGRRAQCSRKIVRLKSTFSCKTTPIWRRQPAQVDRCEVDAVDQYASALRHIETLGSLLMVLLPEPDEPAMPMTWRARRFRRTDVVQHLGAVGAVAGCRVSRIRPCRGSPAARRGPD